MAAHIFAVLKKIELVTNPLIRSKNIWCSASTPKIPIISKFVNIAGVSRNFTFWRSRRSWYCLIKYPAFASVKTVTQPPKSFVHSKLLLPVLKKFVVGTNVEHTASTSSPYTHANIVHVRARMVRKQPYVHSTIIGCTLVYFFSVWIFVWILDVTQQS